MGVGFCLFYSPAVDQARLLLSSAPPQFYLAQPMRRYARGCWIFHKWLVRERCYFLCALCSRESRVSICCSCFIIKPACFIRCTLLAEDKIARVDFSHRRRIGYLSFFWEIRLHSSTPARVYSLNYPIVLGTTRSPSLPAETTVSTARLPPSLTTL